MQEMNFPMITVTRLIGYVIHYSPPCPRDVSLTMRAECHQD